MDNKTPESLWSEAFKRLLPKAKQMDAKALSALRNHYSPVIMRAAKEFCSDEEKRERSFKRCFAKVVKTCDENISEGDFYSLFFDAVSNDLGAGRTDSAESERVQGSSEPSKVSTDVRPDNTSVPQNDTGTETAAETAGKEAVKSSKEDTKSTAPAKPQPDAEHTEQKKQAETPAKENEGVSKTMTISVIALLCAALGIGIGMNLTNKNNNQTDSPDSAAETEQTGAESGSAESGDNLSTASEPEQYDVWVVEPSLPFDRIDELTTVPEKLPGIDKELWGYPQSWNSAYECNAIKVEMDGYYGVYDYDGNNLIPVCLSWLDCTINPDGWDDFFVADYLGEPYYISTDFRSMVPFVYAGIGSEPEFFYAVKDGVFGTVSLIGKRTFKKYDASSLNLASRNAVVTVDDNCYKNGWVVTDSSGKTISGPYYNRPSEDVFLFPYVNSMISVLDYDLETTYVNENNWNIAFVNTDTGEQVTGYDYQDVKFFEDGFAPAKKNGKWGFIDEYGNEVSDFIFDDASALYNGKAYVKLNGYYGIIDIRRCAENNIPLTEETCRADNPSPAYVPQDNPNISDGSIGTAVVKVNKLNIRSWGSTNAEKVGQCNTGDTFTVYEITSDSKYTWYRIGKDRWIADKDGQYVHFHEGSNDTSANNYTDSELCAKAKKYYLKVHGQEPPIAKVEGYNGNEVTIHLYEILDNHMATWDWYYIDRTTGKGKDFSSQSIDISTE